MNEDKPEWEKQNERFRDLLVRITPEEHIGYLNNDQGRVPHKYAIGGSNIVFLTRWGYYEVNGTNLTIPADETQLRSDIFHMNEHSTFMADRGI